LEEGYTIKEYDFFLEEQFIALAKMLFGAGKKSNLINMLNEEDFIIDE